METGRPRGTRAGQMRNAMGPARPLEETSAGPSVPLPPTTPVRKGPVGSAAEIPETPPTPPGQGAGRVLNGAGPCQSEPPSPLAKRNPRAPWPGYSSTSKGIVVLPNLESLRGFNAIHLHELCRLLGPLEPHVRPPVDPSWARSHPSQLKSRVVEALRRLEQDKVAQRLAREPEFDKLLLNELASAAVAGPRTAPAAAAADPSGSAACESLIAQGRVYFKLDVQTLGPDRRNLVLKPRSPSLDTSRALSREFGSDRFIQLVVSKDVAKKASSGWEQDRATKDALKGLLGKSIMLGSKVYRAAIMKDETVWFVAVVGHPESVSLREFLDSRIPLGDNKPLKLSKYASRLQLDLSRTLPSVAIRPERIRRVPDIFNDSLTISSRLMKKASEALELGYIPSTVSGSCNGRRLTWYTVVRDPRELTEERASIQLWADQVAEPEHAVGIDLEASVWSPASSRWEQRRARIELGAAEVEVVHDGGLRGPRSEMTDGAGAISWSAVMAIQKGWDLKYQPAVLQARLGVSKGLWYYSPIRGSKDEDFWIEVRDSQWKANPIARESYTLHVCRVSKPAKPSSVGKQQIPIMAARGIGNEVFGRNLVQQIEEAIEAFEDDDPHRLINAIQEHGQLSYIRNTRDAAGGHNPTMNRSYQTDDAISPQFEAGISVDGLDEWSLMPKSAAETALEMLASGFEPKTCKLLRRNLNAVTEVAVRRLLKIKLKVHMSANVYVMPDPTGRLQEGEVFLQFSDFRDADHCKVSTLLGDCLVARSPGVDPTDVRKVRAVPDPVLAAAGYFDVLVCAVRGQRSLLSYLSGGDYDGDQVKVIADAAFVEPFQDAAGSLTVDTHDEATYFECANPRTVGDLLDDAADQPEEVLEQFLQDAVLDAMFIRHQFGRYAQMHVACEYVLGIEHDLSRLLGFIYVKLLDASKQGIRLKPERDQDLTRRFREVAVVHGANPRALPPYCRYLDETTRVVEFGWDVEEYRGGFPARADHVLESFMALGQDRLDAYLSRRKVEAGLYPGENVADAKEVDDLTKRARAFSTFAQNPTTPHFWRLRSGLWKFVQHCRDRWAAAFASDNTARRVAELGNLRRAFWTTWTYPDALSQCTDCATGTGYVQGLGETGYNLLKVSIAAYLSTWDSTFAFSMGFRESCYLKAESVAERRAGLGTTLAKRPPRTVVDAIYSGLSFKRSLVATASGPNTTPCKRARGS